MTNPGDFAAVAMALYAAHHVGDYWVQTDHQAAHKGAAGHAGRLACLKHVGTYVLTQFLCLCLLWLVTDINASSTGPALALTVSGVTHYMADRREHGLMFRLARLLPGKQDFLEMGKGKGCLGTGSWALDQSWHIFWGVFVASLVAVA
jgi:hypothetical protein